MESDIDQRTARLTIYPTPEGMNSLWVWRRWVPFWRVARNYVVVYGCRYLPFLSWKIHLYRAIGMRVGARVSVGLGVVIDIFFPEMVSIGDNSIIGYNTVILGHEFLVRELRTGPVKVGKDVMIGANVTILPGVEIGDGAVVSACSLVNADVPVGALVGGVPARLLSPDPLPSSDR
ncbi:MAG: acyltransferase [Thermoleophilia bacterium]|nr:acyltransferase [Thermoleophilia bacterium]